MHYHACTYHTMHVLAMHATHAFASEAAHLQAKLASEWMLCYAKLSTHSWYVPYGTGLWPVTLGTVPFPKPQQVEADLKTTNHAVTTRASPSLLRKLFQVGWACKST